MKKTSIFIVFACLANGLFSQSELEKEYFKKEVNDTFKNESIVILRKFEERAVELFGPNDYKVNVVSRIQYKLNDISAIESFSTLAKREKLKLVQINQIKPDGKVKSIYEFKDKNYPDDGYRDLDFETDEPKKNPELIPIEELSIGDIIDYKIEYSMTTKPYETNPYKITNGQFIDEVINLPNRNKFRYLRHDDVYLENSYATASYLNLYLVPNEISMIQKSFNTKIEFQNVAKGNKTIYKLEAQLVPAYVDENYKFSFTISPFIRYALIQTNDVKKPLYPFQFTSVNPSKDDIVSIARKIYMDKTYIEKINYFVRVSNKSSMSYGLNDVYKEEKLDKFFKVFLNTFCKKEKDKLLQLNKLHEYLCNNDDINTYQLYNFNYATILGRFCKKVGIKFSMMAALPIYKGNWNDVLSPYDITWGLYIPNAERDLYITNFSKKSNIFMRNGNFCNTKVILFDPANIALPYQEMAYPEVKYDENVTKTETVAELNKEDDGYDYTITNHVTMKGYQKYNISDFISNQFSSKRLRTPNSFWGIVQYDAYNFREFTQSEMFEEFSRVDSFWSMYFDDYYKSRMLAYLYDEYHFDEIELDSNVIYNDGDFEDVDSATYGYKVIFRTKGLKNPSMSDSMMVLRLGNLLTEQYYIDNYTANRRKSDAYNQNQRSYITHIKLEIPDGFTPVNLDRFNINVDNEAGIFKSVAEIKDGFIVLDVSKIYKFQYLPKDRCYTLVELLQSAENLFERELLLIKQ
jgi:hypothetical protein